jgi:hypothetical protein
MGKWWFEPGVMGCDSRLLKMKNNNIAMHCRTFAVLNRWLTVLVLSGVALCSGCRDTTSVNPQDEGQLPEAIAVRRGFEDSGPSHRNPITEVLALVKAGRVNPTAYAEALPQLETLAANPTFSTEQQRLLNALIQQVRAATVNPAMTAKPH